MTIYKSHKILNARNTAARFRKMGYNVSIHKFKKGYAIYVKKKIKNVPLVFSVWFPNN